MVQSSLRKFKFLIFFVAFLSFYILPTFGSFARAQNQPMIPNLEIKNCSGPLDMQLASHDFLCRCPKNQCRLSIYDDVEVFSAKLGTMGGRYACIDGNPKIDGSTFRLGQEDTSSRDVKEKYHTFKDVNAYREAQIGNEALRSDESVVYIDVFSHDINRVSIPRGSVCKLDPETGTAYWYYPTYFEILKGKKPDQIQVFGDIDLFGAGGSCNNVLFSAYDLYGNPVSGTQTFFGCLPNSTNGLVAFIVRLVTGLAIVITFIIIAINLIQMISNSTNSSVVSGAQKKITGAVTTLILILLALVILNIIGIQIIGFGSDGAGGAIFRFFTGG